ncbi:MAG: GtrA family protein [Bifidobacteriaceae bacterium]|nr:GtrA family protein [Bifidobacteriaceae bacterium]
MSLRQRLQPLSSPAAFASWLGELARFGAVGAIAYVVDAGGYNLLVFGPGQPFAAHPVTAKVLTGVVSTLVAWVGSRYWTFAGKRSDAIGREFAFFILVNVIGVAIAAGCLWVSRWVLDFHTAFADNVAGNFIGVGLGSIFRYISYRYVVFTGDGPAGKDQPRALTGG